MSSAFVTEAQGWAKALVKAEARSPGDYGAAMRRVASMAKLPFTVLFNLHYRPPKTLAVDHYVKLGTLYVEYERKYRSERSATEANTWFGRILLGAADRLARSEDGALR